MKLKDYISGKRSGRDARQVELESMGDPFLGEAIEGFDSVDGDHSKALDRLSARLAARVGGSHIAPVTRRPLWRRPAVWASAAALMTGLLISGLVYRYSLLPEVTHADYAVSPAGEVETRSPAEPSIAADSGAREVGDVSDDKTATGDKFIITDGPIHIPRPSPRIEVDAVFPGEAMEPAPLPEASGVMSEEVSAEVFDLLQALEEAEEQMRYNNELLDEINTTGRQSDLKMYLSGKVGGVQLDEVRSARRERKADMPPTADTKLVADYRYPGAGGFVNVAVAPVSSFGLDVADNSYGRVLRAVNYGRIPAGYEVQVEELINHFNYGFLRTGGEGPFKISYETGACPWNGANILMIVSLTATGPADDVNPKVQFNRSTVASYRLLGYDTTLGTVYSEKRNGGQEMAGRPVVALYELVPAGTAVSSDIADITITYKEPGKRRARETGTAVTACRGEPSGDFCFAAAVAMFGEILKGLPFVAGADFGLVLQTAAKGVGTDPGGDRAGFIRLVEETAGLEP